MDTVTAAGTPLWLIILTSGGIIALGTVLGTLLGNLLIGWQTAKREDRRWGREDEVRQKQWDREDAERRERWGYEDKERHERWAREDELRTFDHRREAYVDYYHALTEVARVLLAHKRWTEQRTESGQLASGWWRDASNQLDYVRLYGSPTITESAEAVYNAATKWGEILSAGDPNGEHEQLADEFLDAQERLLVHMRADLSVPDS